MTTITTWTYDKQLEMLQLIKSSYEMTAACLGGEYFKDWLSMHYGDVENMPYVSGIHFKDLNTLEHRDGNFYYTDRPNYNMSPCQGRKKEEIRTAPFSSLSVGSISG